MTNTLLGGILAFAVATTIEAYLLLGRVQLLLDHAELILRALHTLLREVPGKSARQTTAAIDEQPRPWFQTLRRLADLGRHLDQITGDTRAHFTRPGVPTGPPQDGALDRWEDDGGATDLPAAEPAPTEPMTRIDLAGGLRLPDPPAPPVDVDPWRARFTFNDAGRRTAALPPTGTGGNP